MMSLASYFGKVSRGNHLILFDSRWDASGMRTQCPNCHYRHRYTQTNGTNFCYQYSIPGLSF